MDANAGPDQALFAAREACAALLRRHPAHAVGETERQLAEAFDALDGWMTKGQVPDAWRETEDHR